MLHMSLRNAVEDALRSWHGYEVGRNASPIIDYDCHPDDSDVEPADNRLQVLRLLNELQGRATEARDKWLITTLAAHLAYVRALLGEGSPLDEYVGAPQVW